MQETADSGSWEEEATDAGSWEEPTNVVITYDGLSPEEFEQYFREVGEWLEDIGKGIEDAVEDYADKLDEAGEDLEDDLEGPLEDLGYLVQTVGQDVKDAVTYDISVDTYLATKHAKAAASDNSYVAAGVTFGVVGVVAAAAVVFANRKKENRSVEEALL